VGDWQVATDDYLEDGWLEGLEADPAAEDVGLYLDEYLAIRPAPFRRRPVRPRSMVLLRLDPLARYFFRHGTDGRLGADEEGKGASKVTVPE
jgi:hypothetical protein